MDECKLKELTELRNSIIKRHIILIFLSLIISISTIISFFILKEKANPLYLFLLLLLFHSPIYIFIFIKTKNTHHKYQYMTGFSLILILSYSISMIFITRTIYYQFFCYLITLCIYHYTEFFSDKIKIG